jgi:cellulose synthase/poly-beta-1,6-N-acetylglucosamine synthase-like glycosyltransferase
MITTLALTLAAAVLAVLALAVSILLAEVTAALAAVGRGSITDPGNSRRPRLAVLVPAHNESAVIGGTLAAIIPQLQSGDRLLVVADNCSDETAALARAAGAEVVERRDASRRGKGYALDFGVRALTEVPPEVVVVLDADCLPREGAIGRLAGRAALTGRPVQGLYLMEAPAGPSLGQRVATFAWRVKNHARPLGLARMGLPCQLMGTGMAFPWAVAQAAPLASGHLVEDMQLGVDLALAGTPPLFEPAALVTSEFPTHHAATRSQRTRWEHGHLQVLLSSGPRLLARGLLGRDVGALALALDLMLPPLSLLFMLVLAAAGLGAALGMALGAPWLAWISALVVLAMGLAFTLAWLGFGRGVLSIGDLVRAPMCALAKLPLYVRFVAGRQVEWVRTRRRSE